jgi:hypothetical protein
MTAIPTLPDTERRTRSTIAVSTGPINVSFDIYGNGTDYAQWLEVYDDGVKLTAVTDWTLDSPSGSLAVLARPITDARVTFTAARTGDIDIVGADRPRRTSQLTEGQGVSAHDFNQIVTHIVARLREVWDMLRTRTLIGRPGETVDMVLPSIATRAGNYFKWDSDGKPSYEAAPVLGGGTLANDAVSNAYLRDSGACSVIGRSANSTGDPADISAASNGLLLARQSDAVAFSTVSALLDSVFGSTRGMVLRREAAAWAAYALGASGTFLKSDGTDATWAASTSALPRGYIDGLITANNATDATNDIDFAEGVARDYTNTVDMTGTAMTKRLDADFAEGTGNGMRYTTAITDTTYHLFLIGKVDGTTDYFAYTGVDPTAVLPSGYVYFRRVASILREGGAIVPYIQKNDKFSRKVPIASVAAITSPGTSAVSRTLHVPIGIKVDAIISAAAARGGGGLGNTILITSLDQTDTAPSSTLNHIDVSATAVTDHRSTYQDEVCTNTSAQIRTRHSASDANLVFSIYVNGWVDTRGKDL